MGMVNAQKLMDIHGVINKVQRLSRKRVRSSERKWVAPRKEGEDIVFPYVKA